MTRDYCVYVDGRLAIRTLTASKARKVQREWSARGHTVEVTYDPA